MTAVGRLEAAIAKLEALRAAGTPGSAADPWFSVHDDIDRKPLARSFIAGDIDESIVADDLSKADADLIVTLHRTIDAQLAILRLAFWKLELGASGFEMSPDFRKALALADAILGGDSGVEV